MQNSIRVRDLRSEDLPSWRRLWTGYLEFYESSVSEEVYETTFARLLDGKRTNQGAMLAVDTHDNAVGLAHFIIHPHNWSVEDVVYLQDLYVDPDVRGAGVGRALIEAVYAVADANDTPSVYWMTQEFNETARQLYDRLARLTPFIQYQR